MTDSGLKDRVAAFFDLDKTIIATSSAFAFGRGFLDSGMITRSKALELFWTKTSYMLNGQSSSKMDATRDRLADMVAGWPVSDVRRVVADTMSTVVTPAIYREARELIDWHRDQGHDIVILSASASLLVEPIAQELGVDTIVATEVEVIDGARHDVFLSERHAREAAVAAADAWLGNLTDSGSETEENA